TGRGGAPDVAGAALPLTVTLVLGDSTAGGAGACGRYVFGAGGCGGSPRGPRSLSRWRGPAARTRPFPGAPPPRGAVRARGAGRRWHTLPGSPARTSRRCRRIREARGLLNRPRMPNGRAFRFTLALAAVVAVASSASAELLLSPAPLAATTAGTPAQKRIRR